MEIIQWLKLVIKNELFNLNLIFIKIEYFYL